jgi:hypothetical protein
MGEARQQRTLVPFQIPDIHAGGRRGCARLKQSERLLGYFTRRAE